MSEQGAAGQGAGELVQLQISLVVTDGGERLLRTKTFFKARQVPCDSGDICFDILDDDTAGQFAKVVDE